MMPKKETLNTLYMDVAELHAKLSKANRAKVGACLITSTGVIVPSWNGTPQGTDNSCENIVNGEMVTKPEVIHAELGCILKCAKEGINTTGASIYVTLAPCSSCAAMLTQAGIKSVYYRNTYRCTSGLDYLVKNNVQVQQLNRNSLVKYSPEG
jgi:dCMP deaminase